MSDERYERSADMRLLEMQREALGKPLRVFGTTKYTDPELLLDPDIDDEAPAPHGTMLVAALDAQPRGGLIPGALVTVSLAVSNDGGITAHAVRVSLPMPVDTAYRGGSFVLDGAGESDTRASELFDAGIDLGSIEPGTRRTLVVKLTIEAGLADVVLAPHLESRSGAVLGLRALRLRRGTPAATAMRPPTTRPFYELDDDEAAAEAEATPLARSVVAEPPELPPPPPAVVATPAIAPPRRTPKAAPVKSKPEPKVKAKPPATIKAPADAKPRAKTKPKRADVVTASLPPAVVMAPPAPRPSEDVVISAAGGPILTVAIDRKRLATLNGLFAGPSLGMVAHYLVLNALAATDPLPGDVGDATLATFVMQQEHLLSRTLIAMKLGKTPAPESVTAALPAFPPPLTVHRAAVNFTTPSGRTDALLVRAFGANEIEFLARMVSGGANATFLQAAQLFVGLCANGAVGGVPSVAKRVREALAVYSQLATAEISRIYLRSKLSGKSLLFRETEVAFDEAARAVLSALGEFVG